VFDDTPAKKMGMEAGDVFRKIGGLNWPSQKEIVDAVRQSGGKPIHIQVLRDGKVVDLRPMAGKTQTIDGKDVYALGFYPSSDTTGPPVIATTLKGSRLHEPALMRGARLTSINGEPVATWADAQRILAAIGAANPDGTTVALGYVEPIVGEEKPGQRQVTLDAETAAALAKAEWAAPITPEQFQELRDRVSRDDLGDAAAIGFEKTHQFMLQTYITLARLAQGTVKPSHLRGPVGIVDEGTRIARLGWPYLLFFLGIISVNLVVINFLPIPIVDGGLMVFLIVEKIKGSPVGPRVLTAANIMGLALIACIFLTVTYFDVVRIFG
jgi:regulator of sigma E protease